MKKNIDLIEIENSIRKQFLNKYKIHINHINNEVFNEKQGAGHNEFIDENKASNLEKTFDEDKAINLEKTFDDNNKVNLSKIIVNGGEISGGFQSLIKDTNSINISDFSSINSKVKSCPHCQSNNFIKYGSYKSIPRFMCNSCGRTFSVRTKTPWYYSKKPDDYWRRFINLLMSNETLMTCADTLKINVATAFYWRHKVLSAIKFTTDVDVLSNHAFIMNYFIKESFKGTNHAPMMPREKLWVAMSVDTSENTIALPYCKSTWNKEKFAEIVWTKIESKAYISTSGNRYITAFACGHNKNLKMPEEYVNQEEVLRFLWTYKNIMSRTHGIATKYLNQYFALAKILYSNIRFNDSSIFEAVCNTKGYIKSYNINKLRSI